MGDFSPSRHSESYYSQVVQQFRTASLKQNCFKINVNCRKLLYEHCGFFLLDETGQTDTN